MIETSKDILFLVLSISVTLLTVFLCVFLYYAIKIFRQLNLAFEEIKQRLKKFQQTIETGFNSFGVVTKVAQMAMNYFFEKKNKNNNKNQHK